MFAQVCYSSLMDPTATLPDDCSDALERYLDPAIFRALADPQRLALLARLASTAEPLSVTELANQSGIHLSGVSRHLRTLHDNDLIRADRQGREVLYRIDCRALTSVLRGMADALEQCQASCCGDSTQCCSTHEVQSHEPDSSR